MTQASVKRGLDTGVSPGGQRNSKWPISRRGQTLQIKVVREKQMRLVRLIKICNCALRYHRTRVYP